MKPDPSTFRIFTVRCGSCGYEASALDQDRAKACMIDHLLQAHSGAPA